MGTARILIGDVRAVLATLPADSADIVLTSPPFLALRSYLPADHPDKALELGSEATPGEYLDNLLDVIEACDRVLAPHGSIAIELGDTYAGATAAGGDYNDDGLREGQPKFVASRRHMTTSGNRYKDHPMHSVAGGSGWPADKSLTLIPEMFRLALAYGVNPFTGRTTPRWRIRNVIRWARPNPPVGALADKMRPATSDMVIACHARDRYFDLDAVRQPYSDLTMRVKGEAWANGDRGFKTGPKASGETGRPMPESRATHAGAPPLDWWLPLPEEQTLWDQWAEQMWVIPTAPYPGSHYATWPPMLCVRPIEAMCPRQVCTTCGKPSERISSEAEYVPSATNRGGSMLKGSRRVAEGANQWVGDAGARASVIRSTTTIGWTDCGCKCPSCAAFAVHGEFGGCSHHWRNGVVLDPFAGSGTTLAVATGHGRDAIGIDLDRRNLDLIRDRVGMFLEEEPAV